MLVLTVCSFVVATVGLFGRVVWRWVLTAVVVPLDSRRRRTVWVRVLIALKGWR